MHGLTMVAANRLMLYQPQWNTLLSISIIYSGPLLYSPCRPLSLSTCDRISSSLHE